MTRMLRPILRSSRSAAIKASSASSSAAAFVPATAAKALASTAQQRLFATQSSGDTEPPTALARLYLEDGTTLVGKSFGCHESVEGEVSQHVETANILPMSLIYLQISCTHLCKCSTTPWSWSEPE